jgi:hypothetical protein
VQITFHEDRAPAYHAMPPGGFRLAVVNCWDVAAGFAARDELKAQFKHASLTLRAAEGDSKVVALDGRVGKGEPQASRAHRQLRR